MNSTDDVTRDGLHARIDNLPAKLDRIRALLDEDRSGRAAAETPQRRVARGPVVTLSRVSGGPRSVRSMCP